MKNSIEHNGNCTLEKTLQSAVATIQNGGVVAFPTETYYGLAVDPTNEKAVEKLFTIKRREKDKPILLLIHELEELNRLTPDIPNIYNTLVHNYWPGPLTLIFKAHKNISSLLTGGTNSVGVRISSHPIAHKFCKLYGQPLTATSANISGRKPAESAEEVHDELGDCVDYIIDGGTLTTGQCSTIVSNEDNSLCLVRPGKIDFQSILQSIPI